MSETVKPALTPDQWATKHLWIQAETYDSDHNAAAEIRFSPGQFRLLDHESSIFGMFDTPEMQHAVMALGNHALPDGDPRKITHEDIDAICRVAGTELPTDDEDRAFERAIAKLRAMLPPEPPPTPWTDDGDDDRTPLPCEGGPWHGRTYPLSAASRGVRLADGEEGWQNVKGEEWLGWYERVDDRLVWRGPAGMEPSEPAPALPAIPDTPRA